MVFKVPKFPVGSLFEIENYGTVELISRETNNNYGVFRFLNTGFEKRANISNVSRGVIRDDSVSRRVLKDKPSDSRFCVYVHKDSRGVVRYVGEGTLERAYNFVRSDQPSWLAVFENNLPTVEIVATDLLKRQAEDLEIRIRNLYFDTIINDPYATKKIKFICPERLKELLYYDESSPTCLRWINYMKNNSKANSPAGHLRKNGNYGYIEIDSDAFSIHRVVWVLHNGEIEDQILVDHIDGDKLNNKISNLRLVSAKENSHNALRPLPKNGFRNIREEKNKKGEVYLYMVRWHPKDSINRMWKSFSIKEYVTLEKAFEAAYQFRDTLIEAGHLSPRIKEGEDCNV